MPRYRGIDITGTVERPLEVRRGEARLVNCYVRQVAERQRTVFVDVPEYFDRAGLLRRGRPRLCRQRSPL
jgi:hypothetical protein